MKRTLASMLAFALWLPLSPAANADDDGVRVNVAQSRKESRRAPTEEETLQIAALEGLMNAPPDRALPILKRVLSGGHSNLVKERALFVLSQLDTPEAQQVMVDVAKQADNPLRREAIRNIGIGGQPSSLAMLKDVYATGDDSTRRHVLEAWLIADRKAEVYQVALNAKSEAEADRAIQTLAAMGAREELRKLGNERKGSRGLLEAFAIAGDLEGLKKIAQTAPDASTRAEAVRRMGIVGTPEARKALREAYEAGTDAKVKTAALEGLLIAGDQQGVLELYKVAKTPEEKRAVLRTLTAMGGDAALVAIDQALGGGKK